MESGLKNAEASELFFCADGCRIGNLIELRQCIEDLDDNLFRSHVNDSKNDFAEWVEHSLSMHELAEELRAAESKEDFLLALNAIEQSDFSKQAVPGQNFMLGNGCEASNLAELGKCIDALDENQFLHYVKGKNDFAQWIKDSLQLPDVANYLSKYPDKQQFTKTLHRLQDLEGRKESPSGQSMASIKDALIANLGAGKTREEPMKQLKSPGRVSQPDASKRKFIKTGVAGLDSLLSQGIPRGHAILIAGGAGSGKTLLCLHILNTHASQGKKCIFMSFEESEQNLVRHMEDFGWNPGKLIRNGNLVIKRFNPFDVSRSVDALLMKAKGELLIDIQPVLFPEGFSPDIIVVDSLSAIASAFRSNENSYRIYIQQLFRFFESIDATSFLITETAQAPEIYSRTGVEEFLADGVIVLYNFRKGNVREKAIEILKLRGAKHEQRIVALQITGQGIVVYPEQEVYSGMDSMKG